MPVTYTETITTTKTSTITSAYTETTTAVQTSEVVRYDTTIALTIVTLIIGLTIGFLQRGKSKEIAFYSLHSPSLFNLGH
jgi:hypothetical protein